MAALGRATELSAPACDFSLQNTTLETRWVWKSHSLILITECRSNYPYFPEMKLSLRQVMGLARGYRAVTWVSNIGLLTPNPGFFQTGQSTHLHVPSMVMTVINNPGSYQREVLRSHFVPETLLRSTLIQFTHSLLITTL